MAAGQHNENRLDHQASRNGHYQSRGLIVAIGVGALLIGGGIGFIVGQNVGGNRGAAGSSVASGQQGSGGQGGQGMMNGSMGTVTAVSDSSITVKDQMSSESKTYTIDSSTEITDNGSSATVSDISSGDTVMVRTDSSSSDSDDSSSVATSIQINPSMQGGPNGSSDSGSST
jgi:hypothetical protein